MIKGQASFPREARLLAPLQFRAVFANGDKFVCSSFVIIAAANGQAHARLGLALAKRRLHRAVDRNRVKRIIRESFRHHAQLDLPAVDIVVLARSRTARMDNARLNSDLAGIWRRIQRSMQ